MTWTPYLAAVMLAAASFLLLGYLADRDRQRLRADLAGTRDRLDTVAGELADARRDLAYLLPWARGVDEYVHCHDPEPPTAPAAQAMSDGLARMLDEPDRYGRHSS